MAVTGESSLPPPSLTSTPQRKYSKRYTLIRKLWSKNYEWLLHDGSDPSPKETPPTYVINASSFTRGKPTLTLHDGPDNKASSSPVVGCAWILATRSHKLGLGDCVNAPQNVRWEEMRQETFRASEFSFGMSLPDTREGERRVNLKWKRTSHHAVDGKTARAWSGRNWKLVSTGDDDMRDEGKDGIVAVFTSNPDVTTVWGTLQTNVDWGVDFERTLLLSITLLYEVRDESLTRGC
jgi:hypothetical protein